MSRFRSGYVLLLVLLIVPALTATTRAVGEPASTTVGDLEVNSVIGSGTGATWMHDADEDFVLLTVEWAGTDTVRVRTSRGRDSSPWVRLEPESHHEAPVDGARLGTTRFSQPLWVGLADGFEIDMDGIESIEAHLVTSTGKPAPERFLTPAAAADQSGRPAVRPRSAWGARTPEEPWDATDDVEFVAIHHTGMASHIDYSPAEVPTIVRAIQTFHIDGRGWNDIGYNYLIDRFGTIWEGRGGAELARLAAHAAGFNTASTGVAFLGDHQTAQPTEQAMTAAADLVGWLWFIHDIEPTSTFGYTERTGDHDKTVLPRMVGHRDVGTTSCPGILLYRRLPELRRRATAARATHEGSRGFSSTMTTAPAGEVRERADFDGDGRADLLVEDAERWTIWWGGTTDPVPEALNPPHSGLTPELGDFDGDGLDDLLWWGRPGAVETWYGSPNGRFEQAPTELKIPVPDDADDDEEPMPRPFRHVMGETAGRTPIIGDFDGDGDEDIVWRHPLLLSQYRWSGRTFRHFESDLMLFAGGGVAHTGDFDGDTIDDVLWFGESGRVQTWFGHPDDRFIVTPMLDRTVVSDPVVISVDDREGDDLVWNQSGSGSIGSTVGFHPDRTLIKASTTRRTVGRLATGDLDGDGHRDLVTVDDRQATIDFGGPSAATVHRSAPSGTPVVADIDGDGLDDVMWVDPLTTGHTIWRSAR